MSCKQWRLSIPYIAIESSEWTNMTAADLMTASQAFNNDYDDMYTEHNWNDIEASGRDDKTDCDDFAGATADPNRLHYVRRRHATYSTR